MKSSWCVVDRTCLYFLLWSINPHNLLSSSKKNSDNNLERWSNAKPAGKLLIKKVNQGFFRHLSHIKILSDRLGLSCVEVADLIPAVLNSTHHKTHCLALHLNRSPAHFNTCQWWSGRLNATAQTASFFVYVHKTLYCTLKINLHETFQGLRKHASETCTASCTCASERITDYQI